MLRYLIRRLLWAVRAVRRRDADQLRRSSSSIPPTRPGRRAARRAPRRTCSASRTRSAPTGPLYVQYGWFLGRLMPVGFKGGPHLKTPNLGRSFVNREDVNTIVAKAAPVTASLVIGGAILWMLIAVPIGILSALRPRSLLDRTSMVSVLVGISAHPVWIGLILSYFFGYKLAHHADRAATANFFHPAVRPAGRSGAMGVPPDPAVDDVRDPLRGDLRADDPRQRDGDDERGLRAHGARQGRARAARDALSTSSATRCCPSSPCSAWTSALALGGAVFTESVFSINGLGYTAVQSLNQLRHARR